MGRSPVGGKYDSPVNRESAYEILRQRAASTTAPPAKSGPAQTSEGGGVIHDFLFGTKRRQGMVETMAKQAARTVATRWPGSCAACWGVSSVDRAAADLREDQDLVVHHCASTCSAS